MNYSEDLRLVIYTLSTVIVALVSVIAFMWKTHRNDLRISNDDYKKVQEEKINVAMKVIEATTSISMSDERQTIKFEQLKESNTDEHKRIIDIIKEN